MALRQRRASLPLGMNRAGGVAASWVISASSGKIVRLATASGASDFSALKAGKERLGLEPVGIDDLVLVKQDVEIFDPRRNP